VVLRLALVRMPEPLPAETELVPAVAPAVPAPPATEPAVRPLN